jgi:putative tryptophan/tyrosine transport system substrate-binding protein
MPAVIIGGAYPSGGSPMFDLRRRDFITLVGGVAAAWPLAARAQQPERMRRIGILSGFAEDPLVESELLRPLSRLNRDNGRNIQIDLRWGAGNIDRIRIMAKELVASQPEIMITVGTPATLAVQRETRTIPIVFLIVADPVGAGIVDNLARPGGNTTGFGNPEGAFGGKLLSLLKKIAPGMRQAAAMFNPDTAPGRGLYYFGSFEAAARSLAIEPLTAEVRSDADIGRVITMLGQEQAGLVLLPDNFNFAHRSTVIGLSLRNNVPTIYDKDFAKEGGLLQYGASFPDMYRRVPSYVDRILRGAKPGDLPVELPTKYEFVINLKTARAMGLDVSPDMRSIADEVIE